LEETIHLFLKSALNSLEADLLEVANASRLSGSFPNSLKTAVVKPLLKNNNLDKTILKTIDRSKIFLS